MTAAQGIGLGLQAIGLFSGKGGGRRGSARSRITPSTFLVREAPLGRAGAGGSEFNRFELGIDPTSGNRLTVALQSRSTPRSLRRDERLDTARADLEAAMREGELPFFNNLFVESTIADIESARLRTKSNIRDVFARRRISGASFSTALLAQSDKDFEQSKATIRGVAQEQALQNLFKKIGFEFEQANLEVEREFEQLRIVTGVGTDTLRLGQEQAQFEQELARAEASAFGEALGVFGERLGKVDFEGLFGTSEPLDVGGATTTGGGGFTRFRSDPLRTTSSALTIAGTG